MMTIIHGPMASGKTFHAAAFRQHYQCHEAIDLDDIPRRHRLQMDGLLILTNLGAEQALKRLRKIEPAMEIRMVDIQTARMAIGVAPVAPPLPARRPKP